MESSTPDHADHHAANNNNKKPRNNPNLITTSDHLRHVESMATMPSGAGHISHPNAVILGESLASEENDLVFPSDHFSRQAHVSSPQQYLEMYKRSIEDPAGFWSDVAATFFWKQKWGQPVYSENLDVRKGDIRIEWFRGGITNICYNCLDTNVEAGLGDKIAFYWEAMMHGYFCLVPYPVSDTCSDTILARYSRILVRHVSWLMDTNLT